MASVLQVLPWDCLSIRCRFRCYDFTYPKIAPITGQNAFSRDNLLLEDLLEVVDRVDCVEFRRSFSGCFPWRGRRVEEGGAAMAGFARLVDLTMAVLVAGPW